MFSTIEIFGRTISVYTLFALLGLFAAGIYACVVAKKRGHDENDMIVLLLWAAGGGVLGSHLLYGLTNARLLWRTLTHLSQFSSFGEFGQMIVAIFGGAVFYGGLIGGILAAWLYARWKKLPVAAFADIAAPGIPLMHTFGRIGCFMGGCCYGVECSVGFTFHNALAPLANGVRRFPIQLVEAAFNLCLFLLLAWLSRKGRFKDKLLYLYLLIYPVARFVFEFFRGDEYRGFLFGLSTSQIISILLFVFAAVNLIRLRGRSGGNAQTSPKPKAPEPQVGG